MRARFAKLIGDLGDAFWLVPGAMVLAGLLAGVALVALDRSGAIPQSLRDSVLLYNGGATGARTLLGAVASSTIGVAGTVFSITIAALSLAAGQMGPRLLRNFTRDRGNQVTLGTFLATFSYSLIVLRSVRAQDEGEFIPHLSLGVAILLAILCVATLVYFVGHMASRINVDYVIQLVSEDLSAAIKRLTTDERQPPMPGASFWDDARKVTHPGSGYLQHLAADQLADWAAEHDATIMLLVRSGQYIMPGAPIALVIPGARSSHAQVEISSAIALASERQSSDDLEYAVRQLVEVAVRALSPGINDPYTAISVLDRLGAALCEIAPRRLPSGVHLREGRPVLVVPTVSYSGLVDEMLHMIRQSAEGIPAVIIRILEVLETVAKCEPQSDRITTLRRHADLALVAAETNISVPADLEAVRNRHRLFGTALLGLERGAVPSGNGTLSD
jgi:uncharacterized membrane protein